MPARCLRVGRWSLPATAGRDGWPPTGSAARPPRTGSGLQADSSAPSTLALPCCGSAHRQGRRSGVAHGDRRLATPVQGSRACQLARLDVPRLSWARLDVPRTAVAVGRSRGCGAFSRRRVPGNPRSGSVFLAAGRMRCSDRARRASRGSRSRGREDARIRPNRVHVGVSNASGGSAAVHAPPRSAESSPARVRNFRRRPGTWHLRAVWIVHSGRATALVRPEAAITVGGRPGAERATGQPLLLVRRQDHLCRQPNPATSRRRDPVECIMTDVRYSTGPPFCARCVTRGLASG